MIGLLNMETKREQELIGIIMNNSPISISEIQTKISEQISIPTLNRELAKLKSRNILLTEGKGPSLKYLINLHQLTTIPIDLDLFFKTETDQRKILEKYNFEIFERLSQVEIFSESQKDILKKLNDTFQEKKLSLSENQFTKEFERLMIELSWKSSQIEGNTYDLLDTEHLLKYNEPSKSHSLEETQMLLNHKSAINYTFQNRDLYESLSLGKITDIHTLLTEKMGISKNPRKRIVRITGTKYLPPDNEFIIVEALENLCKLINSKSNIFEKALLTILLISYIQPFEDGNKRTARLTGNALLMNDDACPLSYRSVNPTDYKKAMLLFYELNNISAFKEIFIKQYEFAVDTYF